MIFGPGMQGNDQPINVAEVPNGGRGDGPVMPRGSIPPLMENCVLGGGYMHDNFPSDVPEVMVNGAPMAIQEESPIAGGSWQVHGAPQAPPDSASHDEWAAYCVEWYRQFPDPAMSIWSHQDWLDLFAAEEQPQHENTDVVMGLEDLI